MPKNAADLQATQTIEETLKTLRDLVAKLIRIVETLESAEPERLQ